MYLKQCNTGVELSERLKVEEKDMSQGSQAIGGPVQLSSGIRETGNDHLEDLYNDVKMKLSSNLGQTWRRMVRSIMKWKGIVSSNVENIRWTKLNKLIKDLVFMGNNDQFKKCCE